MYSLVTNCIRPNIEDEAEEIIIAPPYPIRVGHDSKHKNTASLMNARNQKQNQKLNQKLNLKQQEGHKMKETHTNNRGATMASRTSNQQFNTNSNSNGSASAVTFRREHTPLVLERRRRGGDTVIPPPFMPILHSNHHHHRQQPHHQQQHQHQHQSQAAPVSLPLQTSSTSTPIPTPTLNNMNNTNNKSNNNNNNNNNNKRYHSPPPPSSVSSSAIPSIEVLHDPQSSLPECILIQSPSRSRSKTSFAGSSSSPSFALASHDDASGLGSGSGGGTNDHLNVNFNLNYSKFSLKRKIPVIYSPLYTGSRDGNGSTNSNGNSNGNSNINGNSNNDRGGETIHSNNYEYNNNNSDNSNSNSYNNSNNPSSSSSITSSSTTNTTNTTTRDTTSKQNHLPPSSHLLKTHSQRWTYQSQLAGSHAQPPNLLDVTHLSSSNISLQSLKYGITPNMAREITEFRYCIMEESTYGLPCILDWVMTMFPNLAHFTLVEEKKKKKKKEEDCMDNANMDVNLGADANYLNDTGCNTANTRTTASTAATSTIYDADGLSTPMKSDYRNAHVKVYSADGDDDDDDIDHTYEVATFSSQKLPSINETIATSTTAATAACSKSKSKCIPPTLSSSISLSLSLSLKAIEMAEKESERMKRLYIVYRLRDLLSINGKIVTDEERRLANPLSPSGHKVKRQEWLTQAMAVNDCSTSTSTGTSGNTSANINTNSGTSTNTSCSTKDLSSRKVDNFICENNQYISSEEEEEDMEDDSLVKSAEYEINLKSTANEGDNMSSETKLRSTDQIVPPASPGNASVVSSTVSSGSRSIGASSQQQQQQQQQPSLMALASPSRSNLIGIFPHTGKSVSMKNLPINTSTSSSADKSSTPEPSGNKPRSAPIQLFATENDSNKLVKKSSKTSLLVPTPIKPNTSPSKTNLDSFIAKDKARGFPSNPQTPAPPSEATDIAIAGHLLSKCNLDPPHIDKENVVNDTFPVDYQDKDEPVLDTKGIMKRSRSLRRREKKERRSMALVGSMVKVKLKKGKRQSRPPTSPASITREFPTTRRSKKNPPLASVIDQMDDEDDDDEDEEEEIVGDILINQET